MARARRKTARKKSGTSTSRVREWVSNRNLLLLETVLLVGLGKEVLEVLVLRHSGLPPVARVLLGMVVVIGAFGGLLVVFQKQIQRGLHRTQKAVLRLPVPTPLLLVHSGILVLIFLAYAWFWNGETGALYALRDLMSLGLQRVVAAL